MKIEEQLFRFRINTTNGVLIYLFAKDINHARKRYTEEFKTKDSGEISVCVADPV